MYCMGENVFQNLYNHTVEVGEFYNEFLQE